VKMDRSCEVVASGEKDKPPGAGGSLAESMAGLSVSSVIEGIRLGRLLDSFG